MSRMTHRMLPKSIRAKTAIRAKCVVMIVAVSAAISGSVGKRAPKIAAKVLAPKRGSDNPTLSLIKYGSRHVFVPLSPVCRG